MSTSHGRPVSDDGSVKPPDEPITVYWRPGCPFCMMLKRSLSRAGVTTTEINIWDHPDAAATVRGAAGGNETVPTVEVGGRFLVNPSARQVMAAAGIEPAGRARPRRR
jgi:mycoredoxin